MHRALGYRFQLGLGQKGVAIAAINNPNISFMILFWTKYRPKQGLKV